MFVGLNLIWRKSILHWVWHIVLRKRNSLFRIFKVWLLRIPLEQLTKPLFLRKISSLNSLEILALPSWKYGVSIVYFDAYLVSILTTNRTFSDKWCSSMSSQEITAVWRFCMIAKKHENRNRWKSDLCQPFYIITLFLPPWSREDQGTERVGCAKDEIRHLTGPLSLLFTLSTSRMNGKRGKRRPWSGAVCRRRWRSIFASTRELSRRCSVQQQVGLLWLRVSDVGLKGLRRERDYYRARLSVFIARGTLGPHSTPTRGLSSVDTTAGGTSTVSSHLPPCRRILSAAPENATTLLNSSTLLHLRLLHLQRPPPPPRQHLLPPAVETALRTATMKFSVWCKTFPSFSLSFSSSPPNPISLLCSSHTDIAVTCFGSVFSTEDAQLNLKAEPGGVKEVKEVKERVS